MKATSTTSIELMNNKEEPGSEEVEEQEEIVKRKGKRRKKRGRDSSRGPLAVQASIDPETQVLLFKYLGIKNNNRK